MKRRKKTIIAMACWVWDLGKNLLLRGFGLGWGYPVSQTFLNHHR